MPERGTEVSTFLKHQGFQTLSPMNRDGRFPLGLFLGRNVILVGKSTLTCGRDDRQEMTRRVEKTWNIYITYLCNHLHAFLIIINVFTEESDVDHDPHVHQFIDYDNGIRNK